MTNKLYEMFCKKFPPIASTGAERVSTYFGVERIYLNLLDRAFLNSEKGKIGVNTPVLEPDTVREIALRVFDDVDFRFYTRQEEGDVILFSPRGLDNYSHRYVGHSIEVLQGPHSFPFITFSTGHRGCVDLSDRQRNKYYRFGVCINDTILGLTGKAQINNSNKL